MTKIKVMSDVLANKIAAGEVIEKIASVVKELTENSIDAGATLIKVALVNSGLKSISITDNGVGMDKDDAVLSFVAHATSKIRNEDDLFFISTLGFRGEALASISSVSNVELTTSNGEVGTNVISSFGEVTKIEDSSLRKGTCIVVSDLFYNTPARLKFLKSESYELSQVVSLIEKLSLSNPNISFLLSNNGRTLLSTSGSDNLLKVIHEIYGLEVSSSMLEIKNHNYDFIINGNISKPEVLKPNRNHFITFINGRLVKNFDINKAINDAYHTYKPVDKFPIIIMNIEVDPTLIDVNIHPTKQEVKLSKINSLVELIYKSVKDALYSTNLIPEINDSAVIYKDDIQINDIVLDEDNLPFQASLNFDTNTNEDVKVKVSALDNEIDNKIYPVGLVHGTYIVAQDEAGMYLVDQHAAAERIKYEDFLINLYKDEVLKKELIVPINIELLKSEFIKFNTIGAEFTKFGFDYEVFGESSIIIKSHPHYLRLGCELESISNIISIFISEDITYDRVKFLEHVAITLACKMSIKANTNISMSEMEYILNNLFKCDNPYHCPHGRPTIIKYTNYELEKLFKRA